MDAGAYYIIYRNAYWHTDRGGLTNVQRITYAATAHRYRDADAGGSAAHMDGDGDPAPDEHARAGQRAARQRAAAGCPGGRSPA